MRALAVPAGSTFAACQLTAAGDPKGMLARVKASRQHTIQVWGQLLVERAKLELQPGPGKTLLLGGLLEKAYAVSVGGMR